MFADPHGQSVLTDRLPKSIRVFLVLDHLYPSAADGRGTLASVLVSLVSVCQPSFVLPPLFDSNLVELLNTYRSSRHDSVFPSFIIFPKTIFNSLVALATLYKILLI